jgi:hypothetical protein
MRLHAFTTLRAAVLGILLAALPAAAPAQEVFDFFAGGPYRAAVPRPDSLLGYAAGQRQTQYAEQRRVLDAMIAAAADRVRTERIGVSEEGRVMRVLLISSPANLGRLDAIRDDLARLADPRRTAVEQAGVIAQRTPATVMLSYSIHGNEPAGFEAAMWVAYQLLASESPETRMVLDSTLVILNPSANPDGHERFAVWYNSASVGTDEPFAAEWDEPWSIWGRYSHYRFDMNRDLIAISQAPTRAMLGAIMRWHPQVYVDLHSTTEQFFFAPPSEPVNRNVPAGTTRWLDTFGRGNADAFDRYGWQYFTRDVFDLFYAGYFDAGPSLHGATGMTYETDGGKALKRRRDDNTVITLADGIAHHYVASLATVETAARNRTARLLDYADFFRSALDQGQSGPMRRIVILPDNDATNAARLAALLLRHGVEVSRLTAPYTAPSAHGYLDGPSAAGTRRTFRSGALVVDLAQPQGRIARALLEPRTEMDQGFFQRQIEKYQRNRRRGPSADSEGYEFYDVTAWSLPLTLGLEAYWTDDTRPAATEALALAGGDDADPVRAVSTSGDVSGRARSAYVFPNDRQSAAELALALLGEGFVVNVSTEPLRADGATYPRGAFVVRTSRNPDRLHERLGQLAREIGVSVTAVQSAFPDSGGVGVGSPRVNPVFRPRIAVAFGDGVGTTTYGALWYFLERELRYPFVPVPLEAIGGMNTFGDYNVFILPGGNAGGIRRSLGDRGIERLKAWVQDGGVLIAYDGAALFPGQEGIELSTVKALEPEDDEKKGKSDSLPSRPELTPPLASPGAEADRPEYVPGSIFRGTLDLSHWLTLGYRSTTLPLMLQGSTMLGASEKGDNPVAFVGDSLLLAGFAWPDNTERLLQRTVWAAVESQGRGHVVMFAEDPLFRAFWRGPARLLTNAILFGTGR